MVAYLTKSDASEGFNQVIDFLNGIYLKYALTVNLNIYVSYIKQFWNTVAIKQVNDVTRLQALVDKKKVVVTEAVIREVLRLNDAAGVDCLPNEEIFAELARMGYEKPSTKITFYKSFFSSQWKFLIHTILLSMSAKRTSWNEFSLAMASAVICLSTGDDTATHGEVPTVTQEPSIPSPIPTILSSQPPQDIPLTSQVQQTPPQSPQALEITKLKRRVKKMEKGNKARVLKLRRLQKVGTSQRVDTSNDIVMDDVSNQERMIDEMDKDDAVLLMDEKEEDKKVEEAKVDESTQGDKEGDTDKNVEEVNACDAAKGDDSAAHGEVPTVTEKPSIPSPTPSNPPPQPPQDIPLTSQRAKTSDDTVMDDESNQERMIAEMDQDDVVVLEDDKDEDREVADAVKDVEEAKVDESAQDQGRQAESPAKIYNIDMDHANKVLSMKEDETEPAEVQEVVDVVTTAKLITKVVTTA
nr:hypothetical protein [Tanacetum cinerariifolium]